MKKVIFSSKTFVTLIIIFVLVFSGILKLRSSAKNSDSQKSNKTSTVSPTIEPTTNDISIATINPNEEETTSPIDKTTIEPTLQPTVKPTVKPTVAPTFSPTIKPTLQPTSTPTIQSTTKATSKPTVKPTLKPTVKPTIKPTTKPKLKSTAKPTIKPTPEITIGKLTAQQQSMVNYIITSTNELRANVPNTNLGTLSNPSILNKIAQYRAEHMAKYNYFSHSYNNEPHYKVVANLFDYSTNYIGENIGRSTHKTDSARIIFEGLVNSEGHYKNMVNNKYTKIGVGVAYSSEDGWWYIVQIFSK